MTLVKIGKTILNTAAIVSIELEAKMPFDESGARFLCVRMATPVGSFGYANTECGELDPLSYWFQGDEAKTLFRYLSDQIVQLETPAQKRAAEDSID